MKNLSVIQYTENNIIFYDINIERSFAFFVCVYIPCMTCLVHRHSANMVVSVSIDVNFNGPYSRCMSNHLLGFKLLTTCVFDINVNHVHNFDNVLFSQPELSGTASYIGIIVCIQ